MKTETKTLGLVTLVVTAVGVVGTVAQAWVAATQDVPIPHVAAESVEQLSEQLEQRRVALLEEVNRLDALIKDLTIASHAARASTVQPIEELDDDSDGWWLSSLKIIPVYFLLFFSAVISVFALVGDLIGLIFGYEWVLLRLIWGFTWTDVTIGWYWDRATATGAVSSLVTFFLVFGIGGWLQEKYGKDPDAA